VQQQVKAIKAKYWVAYILLTVVAAAATV